MRAIYLILISLFAFSANAQSIFINEVMADNESAVFDQEGDYPDWIELYNDESQAIDLEGYFLSDDGDDLIADIKKIETSGRHLLELINNILGIRVAKWLHIQINFPLLVKIHFASRNLLPWLLSSDQDFGFFQDNV